MKLLKTTGGTFINPAHVVTILPRGVACVVQLADGRRFEAAVTANKFAALWHLALDGELPDGLELNIEPAPVD